MSTGSINISQIQLCYLFNVFHDDDQYHIILIFPLIKGKLSELNLDISFFEAVPRCWELCSNGDHMLPLSKL